MKQQRTAAENFLFDDDFSVVVVVVVTRKLDFRIHVGKGIGRGVLFTTMIGRNVCRCAAQLARI